MMVSVMMVQSGSGSVRSTAGESGAPPGSATSSWSPGTGCCQKACGGRSARASLGSLSERLGMGRTGSRTASPLGKHTQSTEGYLTGGHAGGRERTSRTGRDALGVGGATRQTVQNTDRTQAVKGRNGWPDTGTTFTQVRRKQEQKHPETPPESSL